ncbi:MAG: hypothetical protein ACP5RI_00100 [Candidatus Micrarchaeia archaeon]
MKIQSAFEYLVTYSWAILIIAIIVGIIYYFMSIPSTSSQNLCSMEDSFICGISASMNYTTNTVYIYLNFTNTQAYPIENAIAIVTLNNQNFTSKTCAPFIVNTGNMLDCSINTNMNITPDTVISGKIFLNFNNCELAPNYLSTKNCAGAPIQTVAGQFFTHTS